MVKPATKNQGKLTSIQILRGIAALLVIENHAVDTQINLNIGQSLYQTLFYLENFGAVGVDIFFVISGFVITLTASRFLRPYGFQDFLFKRLIRIVPCYWLSTLALVFMSRYFEIQSFGKLNIVQSLFFLPRFQDNDYYLPVLGVGWTLSFEMYFYLILGCLILFQVKQTKVATICIVSGLAVLGLLIPNQNLSFIHFMTSPLLLEFVFGCMIGIVYQSRFTVPRKVAFLTYSIGIVLLSLTAIYGCGHIGEAHLLFKNAYEIKRVLVWGIPSAMIVLGLLWSEVAGKTFSSKALLLIGEASYSIYLFHWFALFCLEKIWNITGVQLPNLFVVLAVLFSTLLGILFYFSIEMNITNFLNQTYSFSKNKFLSNTVAH